MKAQALEERAENGSLTWNLVTKNLEGHFLLRKKLHEKISKLEKYLKHFPPGSVHLQVALERNVKKDLHTASLNLRVPSNILHAEKTDSDVIKALDDAVKALLRELEAYKSSLRGEALWKRNARREELHQRKTASFASEPKPHGIGPQNQQEMVRELLKQFYDSLLHHARRHIRHDELARDLPRGAVDPKDIVDEVVGQAEARADKKPKQLSWRVWLYHLLHEELRRQRNSYKQREGKELPTEKTITLP